MRSDSIAVVDAHSGPSGALSTRLVNCGFTHSGKPDDGEPGRSRSGPTVGITCFARALTCRGVLFEMLDLGDVLCRMGELECDPFAVPAGREAAALNHTPRA